LCSPFTESIGRIRERLKAACRASKIVYGRSTKRGFVFHDLRHCFSTYARRADIPRNVIMAIMSQSTGGDMNARYDLVEDPDLLGAVDRLEKYLSANLDLNEKTT
jgi:integrase